MKVRELAGAVGFYAAAVAFSAWHLRLLEKPHMAVSHIAVIAAFALAPSLVAALLPARLRWPGFAALLLPTAIVAVGAETGHWPFRPHLLGVHGYFASVYDDITDGLGSWVQIVLPYEPARHPELRILVSLAIAGCFVALAACLLLARAPLAAAVIAFVPFLVVSTVYKLSSDGLRGALMLGLALGFVALLAGARGGRARLMQVGAGAGIVAAATLLVAVPGVAKGQFLDWQHYRTKPQKGRSVSYVWNQTYGPLHRPKKPFDVLEVSSTTGTYWRATILDRFDGNAWVEAPVTVATAKGAPMRFAPDELSEAERTAKSDVRFEARFRNVGLDSPYLITAGQPQVVADYPESVGVVSRTASGAFTTQYAPAVKARWRVEAVRPTPRVADLNELPADYPVDVETHELNVLDADTFFPAFGKPGREAIVQEILGLKFTDPQWQRWRDVYAVARQITKDAETPYQAVIAIERYFQQNFKYSDNVDFRGAADGPLPAFFFSKARAGYCQMFSGTTALMLRMLGIPARVVEGFTAGQYNAGRGVYDVTDRDAHAWVEVYFPKYGWLPFEPTPTRSLPIAFSYSATSSAFDRDIRAIRSTTSPIINRIIAEDRTNRPGGRPGQVGRPADVRNPGAIATPKKPWRPGFVVVVLAIILAIAFGIALVKQIRPLRVWLARDPHGISSAVRADLEGFVRDQGVRGPVATLTPKEFSTMLRREFGVDASRWASAQSRARYGPERGAMAAAVEARREARGVKRRMRGNLTRLERTRGAVRPTSLVPVSRSGV